LSSVHIFSLVDVHFGLLSFVLVFEAHSCHSEYISSKLFVIIGLLISVCGVYEILVNHAWLSAQDLSIGFVC